MGRGIAQNLRRAGYEIEVWDIAQRALKVWRQKPGVTISTPSQMAYRCGAVFLVVPGGAEIERMLIGEDGILANAHHQLVLYDMTTSDPLNSRRLARMTARRGVEYFDVGMSGGAQAAKEGTLTLMVGGKLSAFRRTRKFLAPFASNIFFLGNSGAGHTMKLIHNLVCHTIFLVTCEGCNIAKRCRIDVKDVITVFNHGNARSYISQVRFPRHILSKQWDGRSRVYNLYKDLSMAVSLADRVSADATYGRETLAFLKAAVDCGMKDSDFTLLYRDFRRVRETQKTLTRKQ